MRPSDFVEPMLRSIAEAERHMKSEYGTKMVGVMDTIGPNPHFAMMLEPGVVKVFSGRVDIEAMYKGSVTYAEPRASRLLSQLATDWYVLIENVPTRLWIADDQLRTAQTVTMFVSDGERGLSGEYSWQRYYPSEDVSGVEELAVPERALRNLKLHDDLLMAIRDGDAAALASVVDTSSLWAQRNYLSDAAGGEILSLEGIDAIASYVTHWHNAHRPRHVSILNRRVTDWFVFCEELWLVRGMDGEDLQYRAAVIYPINRAGKIEGALGFGTDLEPASPSAVNKLGLSVWPPQAPLIAT